MATPVADRTSVAPTAVPRWVAPVALVLAGLGLALSVYLTVEHYSSSQTLACPDTGAVNCLKVTDSPESVLLGVLPVAVLGVAFFLGAAVLNLPAAWRTRSSLLHTTRLLATLVGIGFVVYLVSAELFSIDAICLWCTGVHVVTLLLFAVTVFGTASGTPVERHTPQHALRRRRWGPRPALAPPPPTPGRALEPLSVAAGVPTLAEGTEMVGEFESSGYLDPPQLVRRSDGHLIRLTPLLYLVVNLLDRYHDLSLVARDVSAAVGRQFAADHIKFLIDQKLAPIGITTYSDGSPAEFDKDDPLLSFRYRVAVFPARITWLLAGMFSWLYRPPVLAIGVATAFVAEVWLFGTQHLGAALSQVLLTPASILMIVVLTVASGAFHESGHAAACRYGGVRPGVMGCGIYLVWPAFYTDITDSYRLGRRGRLRADLGGIYFNALFVVGLTALYLATGFKPLLVAILSTNIEVIEQLFPVVRFDGYYILSDIVGIPDLFKYIGPIVGRFILRRPPDRRLQELRRWPQIIIAVWVIGLIPLMLAELGIVAIHLPQLIPQYGHTVRILASSVASSGAHGNILAAASGAVEILFLLFPAVGLVLIARGPVQASVQFLLRRSSRVKPETAASTVSAAGQSLPGPPNGEVPLARAGLPVTGRQQSTDLLVLQPPDQPGQPPAGHRRDRLGERGGDEPLQVR